MRRPLKQTRPASRASLSRRNLPAAKTSVHDAASLACFPPPPAKLSLVFRCASLASPPRLEKKCEYVKWRRGLCTKPRHYDTTARLPIGILFSERQNRAALVLSTQAQTVKQRGAAQRSFSQSAAPSCSRSGTSLQHFLLLSNCARSNFFWVLLLACPKRRVHSRRCSRWADRLTNRRQPALTFVAAAVRERGQNGMCGTVWHLALGGFVRSRLAGRHFCPQRAPRLHRRFFLILRNAGRQRRQQSSRDHLCCGQAFVFVSNNHHSTSQKRPLDESRLTATHQHFRAA